MSKKLTVALCLTLGLSAGCANQQYSNTQKGAAIGAVLGAIAGKGTGDHDKSRYAWGAVVGALAGAAVGNYMDEQEKAFRDELADSGVGVYRDGDNIRLVMPSNITFATNQAVLAAHFEPVLSDVALVLNKYDKTVLRIVGHTDSTGTAEYNLQLSQGRALSVQQSLLNKGVDSRRMVTQGMGEMAPIASNETAAGREQNRRVELTIEPLRTS
ncbi:OmpA family protein [Alteromonas facilis]|uniref:OmpA family protein n=1 Tax=Alteromonas facilis TaxID=2048004 RepID=UPI000C286508|nr:OmpA family protein [Alteromonas facilis]